MDPLSRIVSLMLVVEARPSRLEASGAWALRFGGGPDVRFGHIADGPLWLVPDSVDAHQLQTGDCFVLTGPDAAVLATDPTLTPADGHAICVTSTRGTARFGSEGEPSSRVEGGQIVVDPASTKLLAAILPPVVVLRGGGAQAEAVRAALARFFVEAGSQRLGAALVASHLGQLVTLAALRESLDHGDHGTRRWLAAFSDPLIGEAVRSVYADPGHPWTVAELATMAYMARSSFTARFRALTGESPRALVLGLRMRIAARELRSSARTLASIGEELGYSSEAAFSRAFKRAIGVAPGAWRADAQPLG